MKKYIVLSVAWDQRPWLHEPGPKDAGKYGKYHALVFSIIFRKCRNENKSVDL